MVVRRSDSRRRRLAIDPSVQSGGSAEGVLTNGKSKKSSQATAQATARAYGFGADRRNQPKTTDLIPKRFVAGALVVLALVVCLFVINYAAQNVEGLRSFVGQEGAEAFSIRGTGTFASWFSSFLLIMTGLASLQIYALRQHRCDDYVGTYRLWLWMAALFVLASVNCIVDLDKILTNITQSFTSQSLSSYWWIPLVVKVGALSALVVRGLFEVKESRGTLALVVFVWVAYTTAAVLQMPAESDQMVGLGSDMAIGNSFLFGTSALFFAHLMYARFIYLHAHGLISVKPKSEVVKKVRKTRAKAKSKATSKKASQEKASQEKATRRPRRKQTQVVEEVDEVASSDPALATEGVSSKATTQSTPKTAAKKTAKKTKRKSQRTKIESPEPLEVKGGTDADSKSPSERLRELADASRAKQQTQVTEEPSEYEDDPNVLKLSKSQRRKLRKQQKNRRRAA